MPEARKHPSLQSVQYQITVQGIINASWAEWFGGMEFSTAVDALYGPVTIMRGSFADQAELRGALIKLWDLNGTLIAVQRSRSKTGEPTKRRHENERNGNN